MTFSPCADLTEAKWISSLDRPWETIATIGPPGYPAYGRLRFIHDPVFEGQSEMDVDIPDDHLQDDEQLRIAVENLLSHTSTPDDGYFLTWVGWDRGSFPRSLWRQPQVLIPNREYLMCRVSLHKYCSGAVEAAWEAESRHPMPPPAFIWPADRSWCVTQDVGPHWGSIGGEPAAIDSLLAEKRIDVVPFHPDEKLPLYY